MNIDQAKKAMEEGKKVRCLQLEEPAFWYMDDGKIVNQLGDAKTMFIGDTFEVVEVSEAEELTIQFREATEIVKYFICSICTTPNCNTCMYYTWAKRLGIDGNIQRMKG